LSELNDKGPALKDGSIIRFGWSDLKLSQEGNELVIMEPDFENDPLNHFIPQVTTTLEILLQQFSLLYKINVPPGNCYYRDKIIIAKDCLQKKDIYMERSKIEDKNDSGWFIGENKTDKKEYSNENLEAIYTFQILKARPELMKTLALPDGYLVTFSGDAITAIIDDKNKNLLLKK
jgi:hypothetical protein